MLEVSTVNPLGLIATKSKLSAAAEPSPTESTNPISLPLHTVSSRSSAKNGSGLTVTVTVNTSPTQPASVCGVIV